MTTPLIRPPNLASLLRGVSPTGQRRKAAGARVITIGHRLSRWPCSGPPLVVTLVARGVTLGSSGERYWNGGCGMGGGVATRQAPFFNSLGPNLSPRAGQGMQGRRRVGRPRYSYPRARPGEEGYEAMRGRKPNFGPPGEGVVYKAQKFVVGCPRVPTFSPAEGGGRRE